MEALVLFSGGVDSTTCLAMAVDKYGAEGVLALSIYYGQRHDKEIMAAQKIAEYYGVELRTMDLSAIFLGSNCSLLKGANEDIPKEAYEEQRKKANGMPVSTYVPFRNGLFLATAASIAIANGCGVVYYGAHRDDALGNAYPDCSVKFNESMGKAIYYGSGDMLRVEAPFIESTKADVVRTGLRLGVPYELTWSCYEGKDKPCGTCGTCRERIAAFLANGVCDSLMGTEA